MFDLYSFAEELARLWQKLLGLVHAGSAAWVGINAIREFWRRYHQQPQPDAETDKHLTPQQLAAREQKEHLLSHVQHHAPSKSQTHGISGWERAVCSSF